LAQQAADIGGHIKGYDPDVTIIIDLKDLSSADKGDFKSYLTATGVPLTKVSFLNE